MRAVVVYFIISFLGVCLLWCHHCLCSFNMPVRSQQITSVLHAHNCFITKIHLHFFLYYALLLRHTNIQQCMIYLSKISNQSHYYSTIDEWWANCKVVIAQQYYWLCMCLWLSVNIPEWCRLNYVWHSECTWKIM